jgi:hypothetical protein
VERVFVDCVGDHVSGDENILLSYQARGIRWLSHQASQSGMCGELVDLFGGKRRDMNGLRSCPSFYLRKEIEEQALIFLGVHVEGVNGLTAHQGADCALFGGCGAVMAAGLLFWSLLGEFLGCGRRLCWFGCGGRGLVMVKGLMGVGASMAGSVRWSSGRLIETSVSRRLLVSRKIWARSSGSLC